MKIVSFQIAGIEYKKAYTNELHNALVVNKIVYFVSN